MKKERRKSHWIFGVHSVEALLARRPGEVQEIIIAAPASRTERIAARAARTKIKVRQAAPRELGEITGTDSHQGVAARAPLPAYADLDDVIERPPRVLVVLDGITDPHNLGAVIRSAEVLGACGVIVSKDRSAGITAVAHKSSAGALEWMPLCRVVNIPRALRQLKQMGYWVYGADPKAEAGVESVDFPEKCALVIGAEAKGIRKGVKKQVDFLVGISQKGRTNSLNAAVASAIILHEILKRR